MRNLQNPLARKKGLVIQEMPGEVLVYNTETHRAHCLNSTAAFVWRACDGNNSTREIAKLMGSQFAADIPEDMIRMAVGQLGKDDLLDGAFPVEIKNISRREVMRKMGIAAVVALPVIASIVAPGTASAGSACGCLNPPNCNTQTGCLSLVNCNPTGTCAP